ncbi:transposase, partial [Lentilactobacillus parakefiri]
MTKISKQLKLRALTEYFDGRGGLRAIAGKYHISRISRRLFEMLVAAYRTHGP